MTEYYCDPDPPAIFGPVMIEFYDKGREEYFLGLHTVELVTHEARQLVLDRFDPERIVSRVATYELLTRIWIMWYHLCPWEPPGEWFSWEPFYLDDYTLYDFLWVTLFAHYLTCWRPLTSAMSQVWWSLCESWPYPLV